MALASIGATIGIGSAAAPPAAAAPGVVAAATLAPESDCASGRLDVDISTPEPATRELILATTRGSSVPIAEFEQVSGVGTGYQGPFTFPFDAPVPDGTVVALYTYVGTTPPSPDTTVELLVLYACGRSGTSVTLATCTGPYGTCPRTGRSEPILSALPSTVRAGSSVVVSGRGCFVDSVFATLNTVNGPVARGGPEPVGADGAFTIDVPVPPVVSGPVDVEVWCGAPERPLSDRAAVRRVDVVAAADDAGPSAPPITGTPSPTSPQPGGAPQTVGAAPLVIPKFTG